MLTIHLVSKTNPKSSIFFQEILPVVCLNEAWFLLCIYSMVQKSRHYERIDFCNLNLIQIQGSINYTSIEEVYHTLC